MGFLVVLGSREDPHVSRVVDTILTAGDTDVVVVDHKRPSAVSVSVDREGTVSMEVQGRQVPRTAVVWSRTKVIEGSSLYPQGEPGFVDYVAQEWRTLHDLISLFFEHQAVNPFQARKKMVKPFQQAIAARAGFNVPETLVSTYKFNITNFCSRHPASVLKSLSKAKFTQMLENAPVTQYISTLRVTPDDFAEAADTDFDACPHFFQEEIAKDFELRVVVIAGAIWAFRINSQAFRSSELDWRKGIGLVSFTPFELDELTKRKVHRFMADMGYTFGSIDLIVDRAKQFWFLECNQDGAWAWLDDLVDGALTQAYASELRRLANDVDGKIPRLLAG